MLEKPNILWICTDQQHYDTIGALGNSAIRTPNIDRLIETGVTFQNAFCQCPVCTPSRGSFLTGRYPSTTRLRQNGQQIPENTLLITKILADSGYVCGLAGKLHLGPCHGREEKRINDGYSEFFWSHGPWPKWKNNEYIKWVAAQGRAWHEVYPDPSIISNRSKLQGQTSNSDTTWAGMPATLHQSYWCAEKAIEFMQTHKGRPWMFSVNFFDPHHPFDPPQEYLDRYDPDNMPLPEYIEGELKNKPHFQTIDHHGAYCGRGLSFADTTDDEHQKITAAYYAMIENIDANIGRMLDYLEKSGQRENTIVIFMSDHGEMLGDHGIYLKGPYLYDSMIKVPLILSWPAGFRQHIVASALVELVDLAPTVMEAIGFEPHPGMQGRSLKAICCGETDPSRHRETLYCEYFNALSEHRNPLPYLVSVRSSDFKIISYAGIEEGELYDLNNDPNEHRNLWANRDYAEVKQEYLRKCIERQMFTSDPLPFRVASF
jgi:arylsulfatase